LTGFQVRWFGRRLVGVVLLLELDGAEIAEPFLDTAGVVEAVDDPVAQLGEVGVILERLSSGATSVVGSDSRACTGRPTMEWGGAMSMRAETRAEVPAGTRDVARAAFPKGCLAMRIRDGLGPLFRDEQFKSTFGVRGRPGISPGQLALVSILQFAENLTDRQAAHAVRARIDVKYLLGLELTDSGFDHTVLTGFRSRLLTHGLEEKILDLLLERLAGMGLVAAGGRQRTDSTHVLAAVRTLNRLEFIGETLRAALEALATAAPEWMVVSMDPAWQKRYGTRVDAYRLPSDEQERRGLARQIATDGYRLLEAVFEAAAPSWLREVPAIGVLRTVWVQQFTRLIGDGEQEVAWRGKDDLPPSRVKFHPVPGQRVFTLRG
jgi:transposase